MLKKLLCLAVFALPASMLVQLFLPPPAVATCPQPVRKIVNEQVFTPVLAVPSYGAGYADSSPILQKILEALERIEAKLDGQAIKNTTFESVVMARCASCHTVGKPDTKFFMVEADGKFSPLSVEQKKLIKIRVETTDQKIVMPKNGKPLSDAEKAAILSGLQ